jgi:hypothetical protein
VRGQKSLVADMLACVIFPKNDMKIGRVVSRWGNLQAIVPAASLKAHRQRRPWLCLRYRIPGQCVIDTAGYGVKLVSQMHTAVACHCQRFLPSSWKLKFPGRHGARLDVIQPFSTSAEQGCWIKHADRWSLPRLKGFMATYRRSWFLK